VFDVVAHRECDFGSTTRAASTTHP
jgi:hypothetical protein